MTRILIIGYVWPEPASSAAGTRMMELIQLFRQQQWQVTFASPAAPSEHMVDLAAMGVSHCGIALNNTSFDHFVAELAPDMVLFDRFMMEEQFGWRVEQQCPNALRILDTEDLHFLRHARQQAFKKGEPLQQEALLGKMAQREVAAILRSDLTLMISSYEMQLLQQTFSVDSRLLHYCPFMLEPDTSSPGYSERAHFISIGNFRHAPNWDSVLFLKQEIWPRIRQALPQVNLHIYGAYPPKKATDLHAPDQGFHVMGWAAEVEQVMKFARVCLAPLRFGAGIKGKLADAMRYGTPSVTTTIGAEAMSGGLPWGGSIADKVEEFTAAAIRLYQNSDKWQQAQADGYEIVRQLFNKQQHTTALINRIHDHQQHLTKYRLQNFTGAMLRHHHHSSTQYMARWIEAKNRLETMLQQTEEKPSNTK